MPFGHAYPRPEYPRPDRQRGTIEGHDWLNLNGPWQFRFDRHRRGIDENWFAPDEIDWREQIIVPFCWESLAAWGEGDAAGNDNYYSTRVFLNPLEATKENHRSAERHEVGWYRRVVEIPVNETWLGKRIILTIGASDFFTDCWCNGKHLGHHEGGYTPFEFDLTDALEEKEGKRRALLVLRVEDPMDNREQPVGKQWKWYTTASGIWQTVWIEPRAESFIESFKFFPDIDKGSARFVANCVGCCDNDLIEIELTPPGHKTQTFITNIRDGVAESTEKIEPLLIWNPNEPHLYEVVLKLQRGDETIDSVRTYFGMRKIDFQLSDESGVPTALRLNNVPRYLRGALHQSYYPDGVYTASSIEVLKNDIASAKKFGFNFLRIHIKVDDPWLLHLADKMGILLMADFPNFGEGGDTPLARGRFQTMMREAIDRDFNHPSIIAWCLFNETWGFGGQTSFVELFNPTRKEELGTPPPPTRSLSARDEALVEATAETSSAVSVAAAVAIHEMPSAQEWVQQMWETAKNLDPTRLVEDMSVCHWEHLDYYLHCDTDINSWHFYMADYQKAKEHIEKVVRSTFVGSSFNYVPGFLHKGQPLINSEYGGVGALDGDRDISWSFKFLTNELRRHPQIAAYIYTELHDVEWEYNGFLNYDRTPKEFGYDPRIINESNTLPIDAPPIQRVRPGELVRVSVASSHYSSKAWTNVSLRWQMEGIDARARVHRDLARGSAPIKFPHLNVAPAHTIELRAPETTMLCTLWVSAVAATGEVLARNFIHFFSSSGYPLEREETPSALILRAQPTNWTQCNWTHERCKRGQARAEDWCYGSGQGFFEWSLPLRGADLSKARRLRILCEASSHRIDNPQTDADNHPTTMQMFLNGIRVFGAVLKNHPHDARGVLSYLRGGKGAYGYLSRASIEDNLLQQISRHVADDTLRLRCAVPETALAQGGLTIYGAECGRYPICPTVIVEW